MLHLIKLYCHGTYLTLTKRPLTLRRPLAVFGFASLLFPVRISVGLARMVDNVLFSSYREQKIKQPLYIIGNPRSGTTFLHQLLSLDRKRFTAFRLWHTILPAVSLYKLLTNVVGPLDQRVGAPLRRFLAAIERLSFEGWDSMHPTGLSRHEEPEMVWISAGITPSAHFMFPFIEEMSYLHSLESIDERSREEAVRFYVESIQRHLYANGPKKTFLNKEVFFTGRMAALATEMPDARFVHLVRHPYEVIPSFLNMFSLPWRFHHPEIEKTSPEHRRFAQIVMEYYRKMLALQCEVPPERFMTIRYDDLVEDPLGTVELIYDHFGMRMAKDVRARIIRAVGEPRGEQSESRHTLEEFGLTRDEVYEQLRDVFEAYGFERDPTPRRTTRVRKGPSDLGPNGSSVPAERPAN
jgi:hypothetical protein